MEEQGVPAIAIVTTPFRNTGRAMAESWGKPGYPFLDMPHPIANLADAQLDERCDRLVEQVLAGQTEVYAEIVQQFQPEVWRIAARLLADWDATQELVQQAFVEAYVHLDQYRLGTDFGAWLRTITANLVRKEARTMARANSSGVWRSVAMTRSYRRLS